VLVEYLSLGDGRVVTGRILDDGQKVLQSAFQRGISSSPSYLHIFLLIAFLEEDFMRNIIILRCIIII